MNGIHDMGGMHGFGPVDSDAETSFKADWEKRVYGVNMISLMQGAYNIDKTRFYMENVAPATYVTISYWDRWLQMIERLYVEAGVLTTEEIDARCAHLRTEDGRHAAG
jgi:hypothetical protein